MIQEERALFVLLEFCFILDDLHCVNHILGCASLSLNSYHGGIDSAIKGGRVAMTGLALLPVLPLPFILNLVFPKPCSVLSIPTSLLLLPSWESTPMQSQLSFCMGGVTGVITTMETWLSFPSIFAPAFPRSSPVLCCVFVSVFGAASPVSSPKW